MPGIHCAAVLLALALWWQYIAVDWLLTAVLFFLNSDTDRWVYYFPKHKFLHLQSIYESWSTPPVHLSVLYIFLKFNELQLPQLFSTWCCALSCLLSYWTLPCLLSYWTLYSLVKGVAKSSTVREFLDTLSPDRLQHLKGRIYYSRQGKWELGKEKELKRSSKGKYAYGSPLFFALLSSFSVFCFL